MCETVLFTDFLFKSLNRAVLDDLSGGFQCCAPVRSCRFSRLPRREERQERGCVRLGQVLQDTKLVRRSDARGHDRSWDLVQPPSPSEWPPGVGGRRGGTARAQRTGGGAGLSPRHPLFQFGRSAAAPQDRQGANQLYNELNLRGREEYEVLDKRRGLDPEMGGKQRKRNPPEVVYNALQKDKMAEAYSEIGIKGENQRRRGKGHDGLYQGLSTATKDTYDALHMQTLPPR
ncbi:T-cell surface glycoprotein CD3 zeta chain isoform X2 [Phoca vitulina]|uniref:T-cell surface glycoprotein CD3 zeta chain isoform X2 n=1 Tax=Phoca vitulina TaxID=9720 RepID=UPI0013960150|nr:T-cell surface glycoprotein CD3 zeta chain isoform X2 [Phoca vitulina]